LEALDHAESLADLKLPDGWVSLDNSGIPYIIAVAPIKASAIFKE